MRKADAEGSLIIIPLVSGAGILQPRDGGVDHPVLHAGPPLPDGLCRPGRLPVRPGGDEQAQ